MTDQGFTTSISKQPFQYFPHFDDIRDIRENRQQINLVSHGCVLPAAREKLLSGFQSDTHSIIPECAGLAASKFLHFGPRTTPPRGRKECPGINAVKERRPALQSNYLIIKFDCKTVCSHQNPNSGPLTGSYLPTPPHARNTAPPTGINHSILHPCFFVLAIIPSQSKTPLAFSLVPRNVILVKNATARQANCYQLAPSPRTLGSRQCS
ncbi:hypothetical protein B0J14DRAFT_281941 [Halenospora varia]|nr:hypothetical protein B0J14DRAFT_281941 [Halenospora varia]